MFVGMHNASLYFVTHETVQYSLYAETKYGT